MIAGQDTMECKRRPLRILCIEDNPLLVMHLEMMIENSGHIFAGSASRFDEVRQALDKVDFDLALVDIDLSDGRTGGDVATWLKKAGKPSLFITGQEQVAATFADAALGTIAKPVSETVLRDALKAYTEAHFTTK